MSIFLMVYRHVQRLSQIFLLHFWKGFGEGLKREDKMFWLHFLYLSLLQYVRCLRLPKSHSAGLKNEIKFLMPIKLRWSQREMQSSHMC